MNEVVFVVKCLAVTMALVVFSQISWRGQTLEDRIDEGLRFSKPAVWVQGAAAGGALAITNAAQSLKETFTGGRNSAHAQRAGR